MSKNLYLIRGLPGSGKSTFAKRLAVSLGAAHWEADMYHVNSEGVYDWKPEAVHRSHQWCQEAARSFMQVGRSVVISNTFTTVKEMKPYLDLAETFGYDVTSLITENRHGNSSIHGVPQETMEKMKQRFSVQL